MQVTVLKTIKIVPGEATLLEVLDSTLQRLEEDSIVVITSKIVSICEGRIVGMEDIDKEDIIANEADLYLPADIGKYGYHFTIIHNTLISAAGIDESNGAGFYVLWPADPQRTCNEIRKYLREKYQLKRLGVLIVDSTSQPLRRGAIGVPLAHSGFRALNSYIGSPDIFGRPLKLEQANVASGLSAAAVVTMGEGAEQTPIAVISDVPNVVFCEKDPTPEELAEFYITLEDDLLAPFLMAMPWQKGKNSKVK